MTTQKNPRQEGHPRTNPGDGSSSTPAFGENIADMPEEKLKEKMAEKMSESADQKPGERSSGTQKKERKP